MAQTEVRHMNAYEIPPPPPRPEDGNVIKLIGPGEKKYTLWDLQQLITFSKEKIQLAKEQGVEVGTQIQNISWTIADSPSLHDRVNQEINEVVLNRLITVIGIYCNQVIARITKHQILKLYKEGIDNPLLVNKHGLITQCMNWALRQLPDELSLKSPYEIDLRMRGLLGKVDEMKNKILR
jgi:hypothetical protein